ncbi:MAG TPA: branched-chain amino acid ABC transporter permease [Deinococcales bacterium]|nr:branched-chain amino acid ABC transporter permease [Deinococcales bacterium]
MLDFIGNNSNLIITMVLNALLALSLYLPLMAGQLSLASPGFYAIGGYAAAIMSTKLLRVSGDYPVTYVLLEMLVGAVLSGLLAVLVGIPALRLRGIYLALATIAFVEILRVLSLNLEITGGAVGIFGIPQPFRDQGGYLLIALPFLALAMLFLYRLERGRIGRAFLAIREDELAADAMGVNPTYHKVLAFTMGAMLAGATGALAAHVVNTWNARQGTFDASINYLAFVLIGGSRTFIGPVLGGMILTALPEVLRPLKDLRLIVNGLLLTVGAIYLPQGLINPDFFKRRKKPGAVKASEARP